MTKENDFDLIVIGSGLGALVTASLMAKLKRKRVLVLERHYVIGGFTHTFRRPGKYEWDVGVHYVGRMGEGTRERKIFDFVTDGKVTWNRMPEPFDRFVYPDFTFDVYSGERRLKRDLVARFPAERRAIKRYFRDLRAAEGWGIQNFAAGVLPQPLEAVVRGINARNTALALSTTEQYLERRFRDARLKALLASPWLAYGLPPSQSAFGMHAAVVRHYMQGGYYPDGGAAEIAKHIVPVVERAGGRCLINHEVTRILIEDGRAVGVEARTRVRGKQVVKRFSAAAIVSDAGAYNTYGKLLPPEIGGGYAERLQGLLAKTSAVTLYLGLKQSPARLGFRGENHWIFDNFDHEEHGRGGSVLAGRPSCGHLSFPTLKSRSEGAHTVEFFTLVAYDEFKKWATQPWKRRGESYEALKDRIADGLIDLVERNHPGFKDLIDYREISTPLSVEHFTDHPRGAIYGLPATPEKFRQDWLRAKTPVPNLYLTGVDILCVGIVPALLTGVAAAGAVLGPLGFPRILASILLRRARPRTRPSLAPRRHETA